MFDVHFFVFWSCFGAVILFFNAQLNRYSYRANLISYYMCAYVGGMRRRRKRTGIDFLLKSLVNLGQETQLMGSF